MKMSRQNSILPCAVVVGLCFLLTSTGWLAWEYHLMSLVSPHASDWLTLVAGYALQAAGLGVFAAFLRRRATLAERTAPIALLLHTLCLIPAILSPDLAGTLASGLLLNLICGYIAGYYLYVLTQAVGAEHRATALGVGYSASILASWLLSQLGGGRIYYSSRVWLICLALTAVTILVLQWLQRRRDAVPPPAGSAQPAGEKAGLRPLLLSVGALVLLFSVVNNSGFVFSAADLFRGVRVEFSRLFYAAGLLIAGLVTDRDRKYGAMAALSALIIPFLMLSLRQEPVPLAVFWALNYFTYGFFSVFRMIVFSDLAEQNGLLFLCGLGLLIGRLGDAAGEAVCLALTASPTALVFLTALLFVAAVFLFFRVYRPLYLPEGPRQQSERERFYAFAVQHDLSSREREMLRLLLEEKTNAEIAAVLSISENTVKFHIRNLLQKTGCKNRNDLVAVYYGQKSG